MNLRELEKEGKYLFHGSDSLIEEFEPRQAHTLIDGINTPDGDPAVFASPFADYAIFMAIISKKNCPLGLQSGCSIRAGQLTFTATQATLDQLNSGSAGYVYVFDRSDFYERHISEWRSYKRVKPLEKIEVKWSDFARPVQIIEK